MRPSPTARLFPTAAGFDVVFTRTLRAPIEDVWASVTESERTARWFGPWEGVAAPGRTVKIQMVHEQEQPWCDLRIDACEAPKHLAVSMSDDAGVWQLEFRLTEADGVTELRLIQHRDTTEGLGDIGPGWEYYLDMLLASRAGAPLPKFDDYYPAQQAYFETLAVTL